MKWDISTSTTVNKRNYKHNDIVDAITTMFTIITPLLTFAASPSTSHPPLAFVLQKTSSVSNKSSWFWHINTVGRSKKLTVAYKQITPWSHDFNITIKLQQLFQSLFRGLIHPRMKVYMDFFSISLLTFCGSCVDCQWRDRNLSDLIKNIFICVSKMNQRLTALEKHKVE